MALHTLLNNYGISDYLSLMGVILTTYVAYYYYKYFTRVNPLPGFFPFPFVGNLPQLYMNNGLKEFLVVGHKNYGDLYEVYLGGMRRIVLSRADYIEKLLMPSTKSQYMTRLPHTKGLEDIGMKEKGIIFNSDLKSWRYNRQFFTQAILSPKFTHEAMEWTNKLFNELENYWNKLYLKEEIIKENKNVLD